MLFGDDHVVRAKKTFVCENRLPNQMALTACPSAPDRCVTMAVWLIISPSRQVILPSSHFHLMPLQCHRPPCHHHHHRQRIPHHRPRNANSTNLDNHHKFYHRMARSSTWRSTHRPLPCRRAAACCSMIGLFS